MKTELCFWQYAANADRDHEAVRASACIDEELIPELEEFPTEKILEQVTEAFSDWKTHEDGVTFSHSERYIR